VDDKLIGSVQDSRVFENRVLRRIFGTEREEVAGGWRRLHNEELHNLYTSSNTIRQIKSRMRWAGYVARTDKVRNAYKILVGKAEGKRLLGRPRRGWEDVRIGFREIVWAVVEWSHLAENRKQWRAFVNTVMNLRVP
jgi:hypothetical protein